MGRNKNKSKKKKVGGAYGYSPFPDWSARARQAMQLAKGELREYAIANDAGIRAIVNGRGPDATAIVPGAAAQIVANIAAAHIPAFVSQSLGRDRKPYKNGYDLGRYRVGDPPPGEQRRTRELVDEALPVPDPSNTYFCAVELNGSGVRFYGDYCLVLDPTRVPAGTVILERNSYDLVRDPVASKIAALRPEHRLKKRQQVVLSWAGQLMRDLPSMVVARVFAARNFDRRRLTAGQVSTIVLDDEDYIEVLLQGSFGVAHLREVRTTASDAAADAAIGDRMRRGPLPPLEQMLWRKSRRRAEQALRNVRVPIRTVVATGRIK